MTWARVFSKVRAAAGVFAVAAVAAGIQYGFDAGNWQATAMAALGAGLAALAAWLKAENVGQYPQDPQA